MQVGKSNFTQTLLTSELFSIDSSGRIHDDTVREALSLSKTESMWGLKGSNTFICNKPYIVLVSHSGKKIVERFCDTHLKII